MENPGLRCKKNISTSRKRILMFSDWSYAYDLSEEFFGNETNDSRPLLRCRPRAQYEAHELPLFVEKSRSCRVVQGRALVQHEQVASKKNSLHEHTRALYVIDTRRLFYDELNAISLGWRCDENQWSTVYASFNHTYY